MFYDRKKPLYLQLVHHEEDVDMSRSGSFRSIPGRYKHQYPHGFSRQIEDRGSEMELLWKPLFVTTPWSSGVYVQENNITSIDLGYPPPDEGYLSFPNGR